MTLLNVFDVLSGAIEEHFRSDARKSQVRVSAVGLFSIRIVIGLLLVVTF
jgi:hypothetical protein